MAFTQGPRRSLIVRELPRLLTIAEQLTCVRHLPLRHIPITSRPAGAPIVVKSSTDFRFLSDLRAGVRSRKAVDDTGQKPDANANERSEQSLRPTCEREKKPALNPMSADEVD